MEKNSQHVNCPLGVFNQSRFILVVDKKGPVSFSVQTIDRMWWCIREVVLQTCFGIVCFVALVEVKEHKSHHLNIKASTVKI